MIELRNFTIGYGQRPLLTDVNATIPDERLTALLGRNGAGKSTLLRAIAGIGTKYEGEILLDEHNAADISPQQRARMIAFVSTERTRISSLSCRDIVAMGRAPYTNWIGKLTDKDLYIINNALEAVGMQNYARRTMQTMSDGECQRIMIARALAQDTPIILLDEPTSFLDLPNRYELCSLLADLSNRQNKCIFFSTHELDIALTLSDNIALIDSPQLICLPTDRMRSEGHITRLFNSNGSLPPQLFSL